MKDNINRYISTAVKGIGMGAADIVPGVSGGTIAFITGIYEELIHSIKSVNFASLKELGKFRLAVFWKMVNGNFLLAVFAGILISVVSLAHILEHLLVTYPVLIWSFFFGLIIASAIYITRKISGWNAGKIIALAAGIVIAYAITEITPAQTPTALWFVFISGALAICAMILPGISGSFILLLLGKYQFILAAVNDFRVEVIATLMAGAVVGLLLFANVLSWLFKKYHDMTIAILAGFMIGSLNKVWPWKIVKKSIVDDEGEIIPLIEHNVLPHQYQEATGNNAFLGYAIVLAIVGILVVLLIEHFSKNKQTV